MKQLANNDIIKVLNNNGIASDIICHAMLMEMDLPKLVKEKIINNYSDKTKEEVCKNLLGVYGNYAATMYFKSLYKNVENEVPIYDDDGKEITKADIAYTDNLGNKTYVEVKAARQILYSARGFVVDKRINYTEEEKKQSIAKYKHIGKKLIEQVKKLKSTNDKVCVVIFSGCILDNAIKKKLNDLNVEIVLLATDITGLENEIGVIIDKIYKCYTDK